MTTKTEVTGRSFEELTGAEELRRAISDLGWSAPTAIQARAIPPVAEGRDVVGIAQTGTGKTGAFLLPVLERQRGRDGLRTLIICPTRELARQVAADARDLARHTELRVGEVYGGVRIRPQIKRLREGVELLVATPGRLIDHLQRGTVDLSSVDVLILDEADRMLDMGFRPQIEQVLPALTAKRQTLLFSATMPNGVHALALRITRDPIWVEATPESTAAVTVDHVVYSVRQEQKVDLFLRLLDELDMDQVLVFTRTKAGADTLFARLDAAGISVAVLHGDRNMQQRRRALERFARGEVRILVATDVAQRGLDIEGISHVLNFDVPQDPEEYVHRIGRTGRAGSRGTAVTFMTATELGQIHAIEYELGYKLPRLSLEGYDYAGTSRREDSKPATRSNRSGRRMGSRSTDELTPEELDELLDHG